MKNFNGVPSYWWDFDNDYVIVESDDPKHPIIARFSKNCVDTQKAVDAAMKLMKDMREGRVIHMSYGTILP